MNTPASQPWAKMSMQAIEGPILELEAISFLLDALAVQTDSRGSPSPLSLTYLSDRLMAARKQLGDVTGYDAGFSTTGEAP